MANIKSADIVGKIVEMLSPLSSEERQRIVRASLALLGEGASTLSGEADAGKQNNDDGGGLPSRARVWAKQNGLSLESLHQVFHITDEGVDVIAPEMPGKNNKEKTFNAYLLSGIARLIASGDPSFDDKSARALCESSGCHDKTNHATYLKGRGNEFTGAKEKGWTLTTPGLRRGAELVKELAK